MENGLQNKKREVKRMSVSSKMKELENSIKLVEALHKIGAAKRMTSYIYTDQEPANYISKNLEDAINLLEEIMRD